MLVSSLRRFTARVLNRLADCIDHVPSQEPATANQIHVVQIYRPTIGLPQPSPILRDPEFVRVAESIEEEFAELINSLDMEDGCCGVNGNCPHQEYVN